MLNFENLQEVARKMRVVSSDYVEAFWQNIFDNVEFEDDYFDANIFEYSLSDCNECTKLDPKGVLDGLDFTVSINCCGWLIVTFDSDCVGSDAFELSAKCLLKNHFIISDDNEMEFILNLGT